MMDNYYRWEMYDNEREKGLLQLPECSECGERIQDDFCYEFDDELICESCLKECHRRHTDDFMN